MKVIYKELEYPYSVGYGDQQYIEYEWSEEKTCDIKDVPIHTTIHIIRFEE